MRSRKSETVRQRPGLARRPTRLWSVVSAFAHTPKRRPANPAEGQLASGRLRQIPPAFAHTSHNRRPKQPTTAFPHQNTLSPFINTRLVKLTEGNIMDGFLRGNDAVTFCAYFIVREGEIAERLQPQIKGLINCSTIGLVMMTK